MYRERLEEIIKEKGISHKKLAEISGVSIDTISRIVHPKNPQKDSPGVNTLEDLCEVLGVELWEIFYSGDRSFVHLQAELLALREERDILLAENAIQKAKIDAQHEQIDNLKDQIIETHNYYIKQKSNN